MSFDWPFCNYCICHAHSTAHVGQSRSLPIERDENREAGEAKRSTENTKGQKIKPGLSDRASADRYTARYKPVMFSLGTDDPEW